MREKYQKTLKHATIIPMMEERKDPKDIRSYKPVALVNILCKIFERITNKRLVWYFEREKKVDDRQFSFRKQRNTIGVISNITTKIIDIFWRKEKTEAIFFDIEIAYDKFNREKTLEQLENMGVQSKQQT